MLTFPCGLILRWPSHRNAVACGRSEDLALSSAGTACTFQVITRTELGLLYTSLYRVLTEHIILSSMWTGFLENHQINAHTGSLESA